MFVYFFIAKCHITFNIRHSHLERSILDKGDWILDNFHLFHLQIYIFLIITTTNCLYSLFLQRNESTARFYIK